MLPFPKILCIAQDISTLADISALQVFMQVSLEIKTSKLLQGKILLIFILAKKLAAKFSLFLVLHLRKNFCVGWSNCCKFLKDF